MGALNAVYNKTIALSDDLRDLNTPHGWSGEAATAAAGKVNQIIDSLEEHAAELAAGRRSFGDTGDAITGVMHGVREAEALAAAQHFTIGDDGVVVDNGPPAGIRTDQQEAVARERQKIAAELRERVDQVVRSATDVDADFSLVLDKILSGHTIDAAANDNEHTSLAGAGNAGDALGSLTIPAPPPEGATAAQNAAYWATLSEAQRTRLATDRPELVGPRDGFSAKQRDIANRVLIGREQTTLRHDRDELQRKIDNFPRTGGGEIKLNDQRDFDALKSQLAALDGKLHGLDQLNQRLNQPADTPENQKYYLLGIDGREDGKAIVAKGNPDTAANVATYVPGTTADLATFGDELNRGDAMHREAVESGGKSTSVITWLGYDAPDTLLNAGSESYADNGKKALDGFQDGLRESHEGTPSHNTAVGHSYGTTLIGHAARDEKLAVDDLVLIASPGVGVDHASQLNMPRDHVFSTTADKDVIHVTNFPRLPGGDGMPGDPLGPSPTDPEFGGRTFRSAPGTTAAAPLDLPSVAAHGEYWQQNNPALRSTGKIIAGQQP
ncbi:alpha/beta hydrolase [Amycolatopsis sp. NPDC059657]|uniref:alpha/beta hydrolase n=1 Tax=Amycolatopsis sp. NPDC059657 TaxID=3346899 RepID=UPI00366BC8D5